ncbi:MAG: MBL fold metallo-hydrolase [bacterium]|nr:MBL fold metallo-hydrolase [bacterium]
MNEILTIKFSGLSGNCYLIRNNDTYVLIDTASQSNRSKLENKLIELGCTIGKLKLIILTHGDFDHSGNALYLKTKYNCPIGMHQKDAVLTESGNMFINKNKHSLLSDIIIRIFLKIDTFKPDIFLDENSDLTSYGIDAGILYVPGHSIGSIAVLTKENDLICGDLFENRRSPKLYFVDNANEIESSLKKTEHYTINRVYPGHGEKFIFSDFIKKNN